MSVPRGMFFTPHPPSQKKKKKKKKKKKEDISWTTSRYKQKYYVPYTMPFLE